MADAPSGGGEGGALHGAHMPGFLTKKYGPLSGWAWGLIIAVGLGLIMYMRSRSAASSTGQGTATGSGALDVSGAPVGSGATGFTADQLGQLSSIVNGEVATGLANAAPGSSSTDTGGTTAASAPATNPLSAYVNEEFSNLLGRAPDAGGASYWGGQLANGQTSSQQFLAIESTPEAAARASSDASSFVQGQYEQVLGRQADSAGLAYWTGILNANHGNTGAEAAQFLQAAQPELKAKGTA
jgi:hypothetical protein